MATELLSVVWYVWCWFLSRLDYTSRVVGCVRLHSKTTGLGWNPEVPTGWRLVKGPNLTSYNFLESIFVEVTKSGFLFE